ncbi:T9SS type A sorting domain-containing protein [Hymenobacter chitinivorans]|uniref:Putative secreted protein (Por secretion system target) n=1 Tax=Hymenobacter chitinivorans DSM 11115 TaxID=1121954 RepID=A0A2M9ASQ8_9BACT|nr:T9SS type A sorting domain-containing protein [Hymenobacter chitinivorans]PJJ48732.1 putative secreted protein (Por secretion system target) [Hymenobacter chitinivorans DSM 11115]
MTRFLLFFCLLLPAAAFGQQQLPKVLFDATRAEMANNADWVLDADARNLGIGSGGAMVTGAGSDSNPQRFPTPAQSGITANTPETYWSGALSSWGVALVKRGYQVETLPNGSRLTYGDASNVQDLSNYQVFVVCEPNIRFSAAEKTALLNFVKNGGGLFMISDHAVSDRNNDGWDSPQIWNDLMSTNSVQANPFGISFDLNNFVVNTTNVPALPADSLLHGPAGNVAAMEYHNGATLTLTPSANASVRGIIYKLGVSATGTTGAFMAYARYGRGKVVALGDSSPPDDGSGDPGDSLYDGWAGEANGDHARVLVNATIWLATPKSRPLASRNATTTATCTLYPNPTSQQIHISLSAPAQQLAWYNVVGQRVSVPTIAIAPNSYVADLRAQPVGLYFLHVTLNNGQVLMRRVERR